MLLHVTRLTDNRPLYIEEKYLRYGAPTRNHTRAALLLHRNPNPENVTYYLPPGAKFGIEVFVEERLNRKAGAR